MQKAFDTVDHEILLKKLDYYGVRGLANDWFKSYLSNRRQFVSINGFSSKNLPMKYGVPQGSVLGPLLFLIYINDLHKAIKYSLTHLFADDTNLLVIGSSLKQIQKRINIDLKLLCKWLKANKISLNASKTELIIFRDPRKKISFDLKIKVDGKKLFLCDSVKYLGILIDCHLNWNAHETALSPKLSRAIGMLSKIRHYVDRNTLMMIYYGIFSSLLMYSSQIWGQNKSAITKLQVLQNKAMRVINFKPNRTSATPLFKDCGILKLTDNINLQNFLFAYDSINNQLPSCLNQLFNFVETNHNTRFDALFQLEKKSTETILYGSNSIKSKATDVWNFFNLHHKEERLYLKSRSICKNFVKKTLISNYDETEVVNVEIGA